MKYSLRSLMTFSIRDLFLVTVIVALVLGWWLDRCRVQHELEIWKYHDDGAKQISTKADAEYVIRGNEMTAKLSNGVTYSRTWPSEDWRSNKALPTSQAHTPNPPKN